MIGKRPDWVIDLDALEDGMKVWTKPRASRVILILGGESRGCCRFRAVMKLWADMCVIAVCRAKHSSSSARIVIYGL